MKEPSIKPDWQDLDFRRRATAPARREDHRSYFGVAVTIFLATALVYPWYAYLVNSYLIAREMNAAMQVVNSELERASQAMERQANASAQAAAASSLRRRVAGVSVRGTSIVQGQRVVVVTLGEASLAEAKTKICQQAARYFRQSLQGERLRIQASNGNRPARDAGAVICD
ncbi:MAG TPA: hypothetical protein VFQ84_04595 [Arenimonas sp.]|uniref:hypothetical protein n=1 Tax=Arenimonas sp. TaxID=1872635 RepID=UPI002D80B9A9|nr:hypothetical protein [Arenimonas sp.]HEU0152607.1 hypothetical protein [Arenimonas sp.]